MNTDIQKSQWITPVPYGYGWDFFALKFVPFYSYCWGLTLYNCALELGQLTLKVFILKTGCTTLKSKSSCSCTDFQCLVSAFLWPPFAAHKTLEFAGHYHSTTTLVVCHTAPSLHGSQCRHSAMWSSLWRCWHCKLALNGKNTNAKNSIRNQYYYLNFLALTNRVESYGCMIAMICGYLMIVFLQNLKYRWKVLWLIL